MRNALVLLAPLLLSACVDGAAGYLVAGTDRALVVHAQQDYFWSKDVNLDVIASNLPECQRRFSLGKVPSERLDVALYANGNGIFTVQAGERLLRVETSRCGQLATPAAASGTPLGAFRLLADKLVFVEAGSTTMAMR